MKILAIETSCDETAIALLEINGPLEKPEIEVLGNTLLSQVNIHEKYGGVYPMLAKREHEKNLPIIYKETLEAAGEDPENPNFDYIAVTTGPGLEPALWTGITFAKTLALKLQKPLIPVNHMEGHILSVLPQSLSNAEGIGFPSLALLVSGGHTELVHMESFGSYKILGKTLDDAVGEAYDKVARMLGLSYPGGPKISQMAASARERSPEPGHVFPRPMIRSGDLNFSFSGLKTAVLYKLKKDQEEDPSLKDSEAYKEDIARAFDDAVLEVLIAKTRSALQKGGYKTLIAGGGVAASKTLSQELGKLAQEFPGLKLLVAERSLATDNAVMIGFAAYATVLTRPESIDSELRARGNLSLS